MLMRGRFIVVVAALMANFLLALIVRIKYCTVMGGTEASFTDWALNEGFFGGISKFYLAWANDLANGAKYTAIHYPPGYSYFLAFFKLLGIVSEQKLRLVHVVFDSSIVFAIYILLRACRVVPAFALLGSILYSFIPSWSASSTLLMPEALSPFFIIWSGALILLCTENNRKWASAVVGSLVGYGALCRPDLLLLAPFYLVWIFIRLRGKARWQNGALFLFAFSLLIGVWGVHNKIQHGAWLFTSTSGGTGLWQGLGEIPNDYGYVISDAKASEVAQKHGVNYLSIEGNNLFKGLYLEAIKKHPDHFLKVTLFRWNNIIHNITNYKPYIFDKVIQFNAKYGIWIFVAALVLNFNRWPIIFAVSLPLVYALASIGMVHYEARYVTYAHVTYLLSSLVIIHSLFQFTLTGLFIRHPFNDNRDVNISQAQGDDVSGEYVKPNGKGRRFTIWTWIAIGGVAILFSSILANREISKLVELADRISKGSVVRDELLSLHKKNALNNVLSLKNAQFERLADNYVNLESTGLLRLVTDETITQQQFVARVDIAGYDGVLVDIDVTITSGGANGGLMISFHVDGEQIKTQYLLGDKRHHLIAALPTIGASKVSILVSNYNWNRNPKGTVTKADFSKLDVSVAKHAPK